MTFAGLPTALRPHGVSSLFSAADFERAARRRLPRFVYDFVAGGAGNEQALRRNADAFANMVVTPRIGLDTRAVTTEAGLFGHRYAAPFGIAPIGLCGLVHPDGDLLLARAAARLNIPYVASTTASTAVEDIVRGCGVAPWFQLYASQSAEATNRLVDHVGRLGCPVLIVTVDTAVPGRRLRDMRNGLTLPFRLTGRHVGQAARHPLWAARRLLAGAVRFPNIEDAAPGGERLAFADLMRMQTGGILDWDMLRRLRQRWPRTLLLKGVMSPADVLVAESLGIDGVILSNHGGRQLDCAPAPIDALPAVVAEPGVRKFVAVDSGVRSGADVVKAWTRGADMAFVGRPFLYALAAGGAAGIDRLAAILLDEMRNTMALLGVLSVDAERSGHPARPAPSGRPAAPELRQA